MKHLAIIADGNRRWAQQNNLAIELGYVQGLVVIERTCEWALDNYIQYLSFYCFSTENWRRSNKEVNMLFDIAEEYFSTHINWYVERNIKVKFIGRRDRLRKDISTMIEKTELETAECKDLILCIYIDYGGRDEIVRAIEKGARTEEQLSTVLTEVAPYPDAILRTGGEKRLSNFLLWQAAYAELIFIEDFFPSLSRKKLESILEEYKGRKRNFGK